MTEKWSAGTNTRCPSYRDVRLIGHPLRESWLQWIVWVQTRHVASFIGLFFAVIESNLHVVRSSTPDLWEFGLYMNTWDRCFRSTNVRLTHNARELVGISLHKINPTPPPLPVFLLFEIKKTHEDFWTNPPHIQWVGERQTHVHHI